MRRSIAAMLMLTMGVMIVVMVSPVIAPAPVPEDEDYTVVFVSVVYNEVANTSTWTYDVTCIGDPEISHTDFEFKLVCDPPLTSILDADPDPWEIVDPDPTTGVTGIKFDTGVPRGETLTVWFMLEGLWDTNDITVWIKAGNQDPYAGPYYTVPGPACFVIPEPATVAALATSLLALAAYATHRRKRE